MELIAHEQYSKARLRDIGSRIAQINQLDVNKLCIYTTGSYGRLEASENSDLDLFFIDSNESEPTSNIDRTLINAKVIEICREKKLPEFSKDGGYLTIHNIGKIKEELGSRTDDFSNYFTARLLLLLESQPIYNTELHQSCLKQIIERYYVDFHAHSDNFKPIFLSNDIIRFWKTLCLNYEHRRRVKNLNTVASNSQNTLSDEEKEEAKKKEQKLKAVSHSKNLKLKFSRKLTCFSFIFHLIAFKGPMAQDHILEVALMTPVQRLIHLKKRHPKIEHKIDKALESYQWFIDRTQIPSEDLINWISIKEKRNKAFNKSLIFGEELFDILLELDHNNLLNKLLI